MDLRNRALRCDTVAHADRTAKSFKATKTWLFHGQHSGGWLIKTWPGLLGGGLYEHIVLTPIWSKSPPSSFAIIQRGTGVPLQRFWIPVHAAITVFILLALFLTWSDVRVRWLLLLALALYIVMRVWSGVCFIREMLAFQQIPLDAPPSPELPARVARWRYLT